MREISWHYNAIRLVKQQVAIFFMKIEYNVEITLPSSVFHFLS